MCSNPLMVEHTNFALKVAMDVVQFYEREFGVAYPLPKLGETVSQKDEMFDNIPSGI